MDNILKQKIHRLGSIALIICLLLSGCGNVSTPEPVKETNNAEDFDAYTRLADYIIEKGDSFDDGLPCIVLSKSSESSIQIVYSSDDNSFRLLNIYTRGDQYLACWLVIADDNSDVAEIGGLKIENNDSTKFTGSISKSKISIWEPVQINLSYFSDELTETMMKYTRRSIVESVEFFEYFLLDNNLGNLSDFGISYEKIQTTSC